MPRLRLHGGIPPPQYIFMAWCLVKHRDSLPYPTLILYCYFITKISSSTLGIDPIHTLVSHRSYPFVSSLLSSFGARTFRTILSHKRHIIIYDILSIIHFTLLTFDDIPFVQKACLDVMTSISIAIEKCIIVYWLTITLIPSDPLYCH
jgi:hypothetical protein